MQYKFSGELWLYQGDGAWVFVTLPQDISKEIKMLTKDTSRGFGSVKVHVGVNGVEWQTSIFPDSKTKTYLLPIKKDVRKKASVDVGDQCEFIVEVRM